VSEKEPIGKERKKIRPKILPRNLRKKTNASRFAIQKKE